MLNRSIAGIFLTAAMLSGLPLRVVAVAPVVIDYMVLYTPAASGKVGGEDAIMQRISNGVHTVNTVLTNSGLGHISYRLVQARQLESDNSATNLQDVMQELYQLGPISQWRDECRADAVSFLFADLRPGAYASIPLSPQQARSSFSYFGVLNFGGLTTAHELGHNMGGFHDNPYAAATERALGLAPSAPYGHVFIGTNGVHYKTVMSVMYPSPLDPDGVIVLESCGRYSNPEVLFQGVPTGISGQADMASSIAYWAPIIANTYSDHPDPGPDPAPGQDTMLTILANGQQGLVTLNYPEALTVSVAAQAGRNAGTAVDWFLVAIPDSGSDWYYRDATGVWVGFPAGELALCRPAGQGDLADIALPVTVLDNYPPERGAYNLYFAVDYPMDGVLNMIDGQYLFDMVRVEVQ